MYVTDDVYGFFDKQSEIYNNFRPEYPDEILDYILEATAATTSSSLGHLRTANSAAVDIACGTGCFTRKLAPFFNRVCGYDRSQSQLQTAKEHILPNITYAR